MIDRDKIQEKRRRITDRRQKSIKKPEEIDRGGERKRIEAVGE